MNGTQHNTGDNVSLNKDRTIRFDFRVFALDGIAWLVDWSERTYPCTTTPHVYCEALYYLDGDDDYLPDGSLFRASDIKESDLHGVDLDPDDTSITTTEREAWDSAREEACGNCLV